MGLEGLERGNWTYLGSIVFSTPCSCNFTHKPSSTNSCPDPRQLLFPRLLDPRPLFAWQDMDGYARKK